MHDENMAKDEGKPYSIIVADDDPATLLLYKNILGPLYDIRLCTNGLDVLSEFALDQADLVILDKDMPEMTGQETLEALRQSTLGWAVPVIIVSGKDTEEEILQSLGCGANDYLVKPIHPPVLLAKVKMVLQSAQFGLRSSLSGGLMPGTVISGRYRLKDILGEGGYSRVYLAEAISNNISRQLSQGSEVALKVFSWDGVGRKEKYLPHFLREAYEHSRIHHPNVVSLYDFGAMDNYYYLVMEYIKGHTLAEKISVANSITFPLLISIALSIGRALEALAENNLVHRDIKPSNIMIGDDGTIKLLDFGLAKNPDEATVSLDEVFRGTPHYTSPEQILNDPDIDIRSDLYSLGASLYAAATGEKPFDAGSTMGILRRHLHDRMAPLHSRCPELPPAFCRLVDQCMEQEKEKRPSLRQFLRVAALLADTL